MILTLGAYGSSYVKILKIKEIYHVSPLTYSKTCPWYLQSRSIFVNTYMLSTCQGHMNLILSVSVSLCLSLSLSLSLSLYIYIYIYIIYNIYIYIIKSANFEYNKWLIGEYNYPIAKDNYPYIYLYLRMETFSQWHRLYIRITTIWKTISITKLYLQMHIQTTIVEAIYTPLPCRRYRIEAALK